MLYSNIWSLSSKKDKFTLYYSPSKYDPTNYLAVVITHAFGRAFEIDNLVKWAKKHKIPVFEDAVQAQMFPMYKGHPMSDIVVISGIN